MHKERERESYHDAAISPTPNAYNPIIGCTAASVERRNSWAMDRWQNRVAVISGASSGIGAACARLLVAAGLQVVGLARRTDRLEQLRQSLPAEQRMRFHQHKCDVSQELQVDTAFEWIEKELGGIDVLINNAGIVLGGQLIDMPTKDINNILQTNLMGSIYCTKLAAGSMRRRQVAGHLIFVNSTAGVAGYKPDPADESLNAYTPSKFALTAVQEICRQELINQGSKIKTTVSKRNLWAHQIG